MAKKILWVTISSSLLFIVISLSFGNELTPNGQGVQALTPIYGSELMTTQERIEHRQRVHDAKTREERHQIQAEHQRLMQERAKKRNIELKDIPSINSRKPRGKIKGTKTGSRLGSGHVRQP